jgi:DNA processing protein
LRSRRVGIATFWRLLGEHGTAQDALLALPGVARAAGVENYEICPEPVVLAELKAARRQGARLIARGDALYPPDLSQIADAPPLLWVVGNAEILTRPMVSLVGARNASSLGLRMARALSADLGEAGFAVASGLARGIDTAAHRAALGTGTVAVMAGGVDVLYPAENTRLAEEIVEQGGVRISEQPMGLAPVARHFPTRNRIVAGLSRATVVVEAASKSGSLITARDALDQGREVLAVPGHPFDARASGCNLLIRDGARLVRSAQDIVEIVGPAQPDSMDDSALITPYPMPNPVPNPVPGPESAALNTAPVTIPTDPANRRGLSETAALHSLILSHLGPSPLPEDQLIRDIGSPVRVVLPALTDLELGGKVRRSSGGMLALVPKDPPR